MSVRLVVVSCARRKPIQEIWFKCQRANWPDCPYPIDMVSPRVDIGWNENLIRHLRPITEEFILLLLDDHFPFTGPWTENIRTAVSHMEERPDIGMMKLQAGNAHGPELEYEPWTRLREYDREPHPFKRTNLVPTMFRREWLFRLCHAVLEVCGPNRDIGRNGALEFEVAGTLVTENTAKFPEKMLGIHRYGPNGTGGDSLFESIDNDAVREGRFKDVDSLKPLYAGVEGIEAFL